VTHRAQPQVLLLSMPWTALSEPSLGLGILKAQLLRQGISCRVRHLNLFLLEYLKAETYFYVGETFALNDFVFTQPFEADVSHAQLEALHARVDELMTSANGSFAGYTGRERLIEVLLEVRNVAVPRYLADCLTRIARDEPTMVGFTCMFDQTIASVALAKLVKQRMPDALIVLGGYALEGPVGWQIIDAFPWIDVVAFGDGEDVVGPLAEASLDRSRLPDVPGILYRPASSSASGARVLASATPRRPTNLDRSPAPDFDDYLLDLEELRRDHKVTLNVDTLPVESSRGCWWGQTKHCVFCGIDDDTMRYRAKRPETVLAMLEGLAAKYGLRQFRFSDYILPHAYYQTLLPALAALPERYTLSCELKANINYARMAALHEAGFVEVQPGIESFSSSVLRRIDKGVSAIQNIQTLLLGQRFGIEVHYNFLFGFPGDDLSEYEAMLRALPLLYHLTPPISRNNVVTVRFAPMSADPLRFGITGPIRHDPRYRLIFSPAFLAETGFDYDDFCYYFDQPYTNSPELQQTYALLRMQIQHWKDLHRMREVRLSYAINDGGIVFQDSRHTDRAQRRRFGRAHARVYAVMADEIVSRATIADLVAPDLDGGLVDTFLDDFVDARVAYREGNQIIGLALPDEVYRGGRAAARSAKWVSPYV
jgi:ribosomal peptide maturation radical SAM protein 1